MTIKNELKPQQEGFFSANKLNENLRKLMEDNHVSLTSLSRNTGIPLPTLKRLQIDPNANPTVSNLLPLAHFFQITLSQLIGVEALPHAKGYLANTVAWVKVPIITWENALDWPQLPNQENLDYILTDVDVGTHPYALKVETNEWVGFMKGSILIINRALKPEDKDYVITHKKGENLPRLKQLLIDENNYYLKPLNLNFKPNLITNNVTFLGVLIQVRNNVRLPHE